MTKVGDGTYIPPSSCPYCNAPIDNRPVANARGLFCLQCRSCDRWIKRTDDNYAMGPVPPGGLDADDPIFVDPRQPELGGES